MSRRFREAVRLAPYKLSYLLTYYARRAIERVRGVIYRRDAAVYRNLACCSRTAYEVEIYKMCTVQYDTVNIFVLSIQ